MQTTIGAFKRGAQAFAVCELIVTLVNRGLQLFVKMQNEWELSHRKPKVSLSLPLISCCENTLIAKLLSCTPHKLK